MKNWGFIRSGERRRRGEREMYSYKNSIKTGKHSYSVVQANSAFYPQEDGKWVHWPKWGDALWLRSKGRYGSFYLYRWQVKLCDPSLARAISERFGDEFVYKSTFTFYFTFSQHELVSSWGPQKRRNGGYRHPTGPCGSGRTLRYVLSLHERLDFMQILASYARR